MSSLKLILLLISWGALSACSTRSVKTETPAKTASATTSLSTPENRQVASSEPEWVVHPCGHIKGIPYRKYHSFALNPETGKIWAKTSEAAEARELSDLPRGQNAWQSVVHFFDDKGITAACAAVGVSTPGGGANLPPASIPAEPPNVSPNEPDEHRPSRGPYQGPVNFDIGHYYSALWEGSQRPQLTPEGVEKPVKFRLHEHLSRPHLQKVGEPDVVVDSCPAQAPEGRVCVKQRAYDYKEARSIMFGDLDLKEMISDKTEKKTYYVFDYYCQQWKGEREFSAVTRNPREMPGPGQIVHVRLMNTEHIWPQSKFPAKEGSAAHLMMKTDHHHIFSTDTKVNADRSNFEFAEVEQNGAKQMHCGDGKLGQAIAVENARGPATKTFEPPKNFKGDVARALFYFSARYNAGMSAQQEHYLRKWHREDPVDAREQQRHDKIYRLIGVRNPFIDHADLIDRISRFCRFQAQADQVATEFDCP